MADTSGDDLAQQREALLRQKREAMQQASEADRKIMELYLEQESEQQAEKASDAQQRDGASNDGASNDGASSDGQSLAKVLELLVAQEERSAAVQHVVQEIHQTLGEGSETQRQLIATMDNTIGTLANQLAALHQEVRTEFQQNASSRAAEEETRQRDQQATQQAAAEQQRRLAQWQNVIFGSTLATDALTAELRGQLIDQLLVGEPTACNLVGQLLQVQAAGAERLPQLLQDLGEAYYAWRPKSEDIVDPMEQATVALVIEKTEAVGGGNTIEIVRPGDRFDSSRHDSKARGAEVTAVHGWVVLRSNGKVYTRARVSVQ